MHHFFRHKVCGLARVQAVAAAGWSSAMGSFLAKPNYVRVLVAGLDFSGKTSASRAPLRYVDGTFSQAHVIVLQRCCSRSKRAALRKRCRRWVGMLRYLLPSWTQVFRRSVILTDSAREHCTFAFSRLVLTPVTGCQARQGQIYVLGAPRPAPRDRPFARPSPSRVHLRARRTHRLSFLMPLCR